MGKTLKCLKVLRTINLSLASDLIFMAASWTLGKNILAETPDYVAINKPSGMLSIPDRFDQRIPSLSGLLQKRYPEIYTVHRLDRDTSGLIVFARNKDFHRYLSLCFESRQVEKFYLALIPGKLSSPQGRIELPIAEHPAANGKMMIAKKGKAAITDYQVLKDFTLFSLLRLQIHTGRTHQIRVHLQALGYPLVGDNLYGKGAPVYLSAFKPHYKLSKDQEKEKPLLSRLALHASELSFPDEQGQKQVLEAPLPKDLQALVHQLEKHLGGTGLST